MSGFIGICNTDGAPVDGPLLERLTRGLAVCGPERQAVWRDGAVAFGHALLAETFESEHECQPCSFDGQVWITADARVDGRAELISRLRAAGRVVSNDAPDVELILHAYHVWGEGCLEQLIGDFAFAMWDGRTQRLFCARDQLGQRPFYYALVGQCLLVSSALNCLRLHPAVSDRLNEQAVGDFLLRWTNQDTGTTTFADIRQLPPAHMLVWDGALRLRRYWAFPESFTPVRFKRETEYAEQFGALFQQAVGDRVRTDRVGAHLSGGMDSTSVVAAAHQALRERGAAFDLRGYTTVYRWLVNEEEGLYAVQVAEALGIPCEQLVAENFLTQEPEAAPDWVHPEPCLIPNLVTEGEILRRTAAFSRVLLMGFGGDPLFYDDRSWWAQFSSANWGAAARDLWRAWSVYGCRPRLGIRSTLRRWTKRDDGAPALPAWLNPDFVRRAGLAERMRRLEAEDESGCRTYLRRMLAPYWTNLFRWSHPGFHGLPAQGLFPFFDLRLMEYVAATPPLPWRENKLLLREAMRGRLPETVRQRPKRVLYASRSQVDPDRPTHKLAILRESRHWRRELVNTTPALAQFINLERILNQIETPDPAAARATPEHCLSLAYWLRHQRRPEAQYKKEIKDVGLIEHHGNLRTIRGGVPTGCP